MQKDMNIEKAAIELYDTYCAAVGGRAWDGKPLPTGQQFFADPAKQVQAEGWRAVAKRATALVTAVGVGTTREPGTESSTFKKDRAAVKETTEQD